MTNQMIKLLISIWAIFQLVDAAPRNNLAASLNENFYDDVRQLIKRRTHDYPLPRQFNNIPTPVLEQNWPAKPLTLGQISGVAIDQHGNPAIFHRGPRIWDYTSFNGSHHFQHINEGPIETNTILLLNPKTGALEYSWGGSMFYMPHGLTIDIHGNYWVTDVALHQVFKFKAFNETAVLILGQRFEPGNSIEHFCKPTSVAVASTGEIFVADGYCNRRIIKFNAAGRPLTTIPHPLEFLSLVVPHGLTLLEERDLLCIADRENMRVVCPKAGLRTSFGQNQPAATIQEPDLGRVFDVASYGDIVFAVNGPTSSIFPVRGFTIDPRSEKIIDHWGEFTNPHAIAVDKNGTALYVVEIGPNRIWKYILA